jgi:hypothetical protein
MKIIDANGRLLGLINVIDFFFIVAVVLGGIIAYNYFFSPTPVPQNKNNVATNPPVEEKVAVVTMSLRARGLMESIAVGDTEKDDNGAVIAEIVSLDPENAVAVVKIVGRWSDEVLMFKGKRVKAGYQLAIETDDALINGLITRVQVNTVSIP